MPDVTTTGVGRAIAAELRKLRATTARLRALEAQQAREAVAAQEAGATLAAIGQSSGMTAEGARKMIQRGRL